MQSQRQKGQQDVSERRSPLSRLYRWAKKCQINKAIWINCCFLWQMSNCLFRSRPDRLQLRQKGRSVSGKKRDIFVSVILFVVHLFVLIVKWLLTDKTGEISSFKVYEWYKLKERKQFKQNWTIERLMCGSTYSRRPPGWTWWQENRGRSPPCNSSAPLGSSGFFGCVVSH